MKINRKITIYVIGLLLIISLSLAYKFTLAGTLFWKTYNKPQVNFSFKYPNNWIVEEELYPEVGQNFVYVSDKSVNTDHLNPFDKDSRYRLTITDIGEQAKEIDLKAWYSKWVNDLEETNEKNKGTLPMTGLIQSKIPILGAKINDRLEYENGIVPSQLVDTIASVTGAGESSIKYFMVMVNSRIYKIEFFPIDGHSPLKLILKTLKFK